MDLSSVSAAELDRRLRDFLAKGREIDVDFLLHLGEVDRRRTYEHTGHPTLWQYCVKHLGLSEGQTYRRTNAARILRRVPLAAEYLRDGRLCMTRLVYFKDVLTLENARRLLDRAAGKSQEEAERIAEAEKPPKPLPSSTIRARPMTSVLASANATTEAADAPPCEANADAEIATGRSVEPASGSDEDPTAATAERQTVAGEPEGASQAEVATFTRGARVELKPHGADAFLLRVAASATLVEKLRKARSILSHVIPNGDIAAVIERALDEFLLQDEKKHGEAGRNGRKPRATEGIPAQTRRELWMRDGGRCAWPMPDGTVCGSTWQLEPITSSRARSEGRTSCRI